MKTRTNPLASRSGRIIADDAVELAPARLDYEHHETVEDNGDAHLKSLLLHHETTLPVTNGKLDQGTWQRVFYAQAGDCKGAWSGVK